MMNILGATLGDPIWQVLAVVLAFAAPLLIITVRTRDVHASEHELCRDTRRTLLGCLAAFLVMSGLMVVVHVPSASSSATHSSPTAVPTATPTPSPLPTPTPSPSPTPRLARSITEVLMTFCDAINRQHYQTAWNEYARSLQKTHPQAPTITAWERFTRCRIPDQSGDPSAWTILILTLPAGSIDRMGRSGDIDYRLTMAVERNAWKITGVCEIYAEGCFAVHWG